MKILAISCLAIIVGGCFCLRRTLHRMEDERLFADATEPKNPMPCCCSIKLPAGVFLLAAPLKFDGSDVVTLQGDPKKTKITLKCE